MINMLFRTVKKTEKKIVYKTARKIEKILISPEYNYCGRCGRTFKPRENKNDSDKCPDCVCVKCGRSLMDRPRHHKLCGFCWGMGTLGRSYSFSSTHVDAKYEYKFVDISEPIEESYSFDKEELIDIADITYDKENAVIRKHVKLDDIFNININEKNVEDLEYWYGVKNFKDVIEIFRKKATVLEIDTSDLKEIVPNYEIVDEKQELEEFHSVVGFYPDVPAFIMGHPLNMFNNIRRNVKKIEKKITIWYNTAIDSRYSQTVYKNKGISAFALWKHLCNQGINAEIRLIDCSFIIGETLMLECKLTKEYISEYYDLIYKVLTEVSFLRVYLNNYKINLIKESLISKKWEAGMGYEISDADLKKIIDIEEKDILINNVASMNLNGKSVVIDYHEMMNYLNFLT